jgi:hypothetical protein
MSKSLFSIMMLLMVSCVFGDHMLLEYKDVQFFKVRETQSVPIVFLEISGLAFHSSLAVEKVETQREDKSLVILIHLTPARSGLTGNFTYIFDVPASIESVYFGTGKHLIWKRGVGPSPMEKP